MLRPSDGPIPPLLHGARGEEFQIDPEEKRPPRGGFWLLFWLLAVIFYASVLGAGVAFFARILAPIAQ